MNKCILQYVAHDVWTNCIKPVLGLVLCLAVAFGFLAGLAYAYVWLITTVGPFPTLGICIAFLLLLVIVAYVFYSYKDAKEHCK